MRRALDEQLRRVILTLEPQWSEKRIDVEVKLEPVTILANEELLWQAWTNIIGNAVKFTPEDGWIGISLTTESDNAVVKISDNGIGMNEEQSKRIFDKFYQCDKSHSGLGNGLGLSLAKRIIDLSEGGITVESEEGKGSAFTVSLPNVVD